MSWVNVVWPMVASACLTLGAVHAVIGIRRKTSANLWFSLTAVGAAALSACELISMRSDTPARWAAALRWGHLAFFVIFVSLVFFVRTYFGAGRPWLGAAAIAMRCVALAVNFAKPPNLNYTAITGVRIVSFWLGERIYLPVGTLSRWTRVGVLSFFLLLAFLIDATRTVWLRGDRKRAMTCASATLFLIAAAINGAVIYGGLGYPYLISIAYLGILAAMSFDLTREVVRASELSRQVEDSAAFLIESRNVAVLAAQEAQQAGDWFRRVVEAAPNALIMTDAGGTIRLVNARTEAVFGYSRDELVGLPIETLVPESFRGGHPGFRSAYFADPTTRPMGAGRELFGRRKDGSEVPVEVGLNPIRARDGVFVLASVIDITERRRSELEFDQQRDELAHLSRLTTIGELAGSLAHELNQPLTAILSNAQAAQRLLVRQPPDLEEVGAILADIVDSDRHAGEVIRRLRMMLRKGEEHQERLDMSEIVRDVMKLGRSDFLSNGVAVSANLDSGLPAIAGDRVQLLQVLLNLALNGCEAMAQRSPGRRQLDFRAEPWPGDGGGGVHVSVADRGTGIPEGQLDNIFKPFFTTKGQGMGLGLSVCRSIVSAHGGRIWATNNDDGGATLHVVLPAEKA